MDTSIISRLADNAFYCWLVHDPATKRILWANKAACDALGYTVEELRALKAHHMSSQAVRYRREMGTTWLQGAVVHGHNRTLWKYRRRDGHEFMADASAKLVDLDEGRVLLVEFRELKGKLIDDSSSQWVQDSLNHLLAHTSSGLLIVDDELHIMDASPFAARLLNTTVEKTIGKRIDELGETDISIDTEEIRAELLRVDGSANVRLRVELESAPDRWLACAMDNIFVHGSVARVMSIRDITHKVDMERRAAFQEANLQYLSRYNAMGDMAMILAHDLGQPIAAATNYIDGIRRRLEQYPKTPAHVTYGLQQATRQLNRTADIVSSVKKYVRRIESALTVFDLNETIEESLYFVKLRAAGGNATVAYSPSVTPIFVKGQSVLIGQVIINVCTNALEEANLHAPDTQVVVESLISDGRVRILIHDDGRGYDHEPNLLLAKGAFSSKEDGSGIGLIISEHILERHGGSLSFGRREEGGTTATIELPLEVSPTDS